MSTLGEFHADVLDCLGRSGLTQVIPKRVRMAASWIERNYTFQYMREWKTLEVDSAASYPHIVSLHALQVKRVELLRRRQADAATTGYVFGRPLRQVRPADRETRSVGEPESYWLNGVSSLVFNSIPDEDMTFEAHFQLLTQWGSGDSWTHWLLDNAEQLLLCRTLMMMGIRLRDTKLHQTYQAEFDLEIATWKVHEEEVTAGDFVQVWEPPEYAQFDNSLRST